MVDESRMVVIASYLRPDEAGMLRGLLESSGIAAVVQDEYFSAVSPYLQPAIGGSKLAVHASDVEQALELVRTAGVLPGPGPADPIEISEDEWKRVPEPNAGDVAGRPTAWSPLALMAALFVAAVLALLWATRRP